MPTVSCLPASIAEGCRQAGCALIGGETAEMPGMYAAGDYDLAGFCVGAVDRDKVLTGDRIAPGDVILGLASSGVHSNGFSLVRKIVASQGWDLHGEIGEVLLRPTRIYVRSLLPLVRDGLVKGLAHITGGGLIENIPRVLPRDCHAVVDTEQWSLPDVFGRLRKAGNVSFPELVRTFNCGVGMTLIVEPDRAASVMTRLRAAGETVFPIGRIQSGDRGCTVQGSALGAWESDDAWTVTHHA